MSEHHKTEPVSGQTGQAAEKTDAGRLSSLLGMLGLCAKAGKLIMGTDRVCEALRQRTPGSCPLLVIEAEGTSDNTHKKLTDKCTYYKTKHRKIPVDALTLARALGRNRELAAVGITDENLCRAVEKKLNAVC